MLISDIGLPDGDGWELLRQVQAQSARPLFAVAMSGFGLNADHVRSKDAGYRHHLLKPFAPAELNVDPGRSGARTQTGVVEATFLWLGSGSGGMTTLRTKSARVWGFGGLLFEALRCAFVFVVAQTPGHPAQEQDRLLHGADGPPERLFRVDVQVGQQGFRGIGVTRVAAEARVAAFPDL